MSIHTNKGAVRYYDDVPDSITFRPGKVASRQYWAAMQ